MMIPRGSPVFAAPHVGDMGGNGAEPSLLFLMAWSMTASASGIPISFRRNIRLWKKLIQRKGEECRGLGRSFGYNRAEGEAETIKPAELIYLLVDIVSKNGNLLLDVGPEADGTIPNVQMDRLKALGAWLQANGEAIYGTQPWKRAMGETVEGIPVRFTQKEATTYAILLGEPKAATVTFKSISAKPGTKVHLVGSKDAIAWSQEGNDLRVTLPDLLSGHYAYAFSITDPLD